MRKIFFLFLFLPAGWLLLFPELHCGSRLRPSSAWPG
jgi:hypothetical protein